MGNEYIEEVQGLVLSITDCDEANEILNKISEYFLMNYITKSQKEQLENDVHSECMAEGINLGIDDYDWEEMCLYNTDLKD
ncbi:hypothetical protein [Priestia aryabhattai]|uniref:hypothetical protein n=1 Tax=Priestia aryabhattai TaxID=412384 RepID=UPI0015F3FDC9|nr:hypothetical protein [Priestia aryabhattai]